ncbi:MAG: DUF86 domain-containing protein [Terracidiphilus sp.]|jgi:uncharacterized protein with HEPN domain
MPFEDAKSHLSDILDSIRLIEKFVSGMSFEAYSHDEKTQAAVERKMLIISEAAIRLKDEAEVLCPGIPWRDIRGTGNWLPHQYDGVDAETIWNTIESGLPPLKAAVEKALASPERS